MKKRSVLHVDLDAFFVSVERVLDPNLCGKPVVVGGSSQQRGVVAAASYEARQYGVHSAMAMSQAMRLCPDLTRVSGTHKMYSRASRAVFRLLNSYTPIIEKVSIDEAYLDLTGTHHLFGDALDAANEMQRRVKEELRLDLSIGVSGNRLVSKVASGHAKPFGLCDVVRGGEARFFAPLAVKKLPGIGPVTANKLRSLNIDCLGSLADTEQQFLKDTFGSHGAVMQRRARGECSVEVCPPGERSAPKSIGHEQTFANNIDDMKLLRGHIQLLLEHACSRMRSKTLAAKTLSLKVRFADFTTRTSDVSLSQHSDNEQQWLPQAVALLEKRLKHRSLVRLLGVRFTNFSSNYYQSSLFNIENEEQRARTVIADELREKYAGSSFKSGASLWVSD
ncbi:DNA polymerase IV [Planctomycetota bacterium]|nr:DNA polymerase IV [Planctomycetota bacterium]